MSRCKRLYAMVGLKLGCQREELRRRLEKELDLPAWRGSSKAEDQRAAVQEPEHSA